MKMQGQSPASENVISFQKS